MRTYTKDPKRIVFQETVDSFLDQRRKIKLPRTIGAMIQENNIRIMKPKIPINPIGSPTMVISRIIEIIGKTIAVTRPLPRLSHGRFEI